MSKKANVKPGRVVVVVLVLIGLWTTIDNGVRITKEMVSGVTHVVKNHRWNSFASK